MHVSSFGMYGFAILSSADFRKTMSFCERYHVLATPLVMLRFREEHGLGIWSIDPIADTPVNDPLYRFIVEMQMGIILSLLRDVMGPSRISKPSLRKYTIEFSSRRARVSFELHDRRPIVTAIEGAVLDPSPETYVIPRSFLRICKPK
jgi:hypothetical protein